MTKHSILDDIPEVVRDKVQRALRNIAPLSDEHHGTGTHVDQEFDAAMAPAEESLDELRRICTREGIDANAVIACSARMTRCSISTAESGGLDEPLRDLHRGHDPRSHL